MDLEEKKPSIIPSVLDEGLGFNIYRVGLLFRRELMRALVDYEMTPEQWQVMMTLWHTDKPINQSEIVKMLLKDKHTVSRIIQRLERDGWIKKKSDSADARVTIIQLTVKGEALKAEVPQRLFNHFEEVLKDFDDEEIQPLLLSLKRLRGILGDY